MSSYHDPYDPNEVDERPRSSYLSKKDAKAMLIFAVIAVIACTPLYRMMRENGRKTFCQQNMHAIQSAMLAYAELHDDRFPPLCEIGNNFEPLLHDGRPFTWASAIFEGMKRTQNFRCPSANESEVTHAFNPIDSNKIIDMTYGMYAAWSGHATWDISDSAQAVLITETSNHGANDTYNPVPFVDAEGNTVKEDGFYIGWDQGNRIADWKRRNTTAYDMPKFVTRLAFPGTSKGNFNKKGASRHSRGNHALFCDGHVELLLPSSARVEYIDVGGELTGIWRTR